MAEASSQFFTASPHTFQPMMQAWTSPGSALVLNIAPDRSSALAEMQRVNLPEGHQGAS
ncbi:hypothetical protein RB623_07740 [Mesorhizobium sp. LHD-90]|uniref:hypothetical protein n=1 Tax=Mesorhizobium sp. LHD-90 TaxID=3071414 RepID=UPI0027E1243C|nr:hypothetical protein [Mesorhizobium sp. LHD-90]MDQ6433937.1 hypothetical protein [Mesorhizobium sp. LHD-90]